MPDALPGAGSARKGRGAQGGGLSACINEDFAAAGLIGGRMSNHGQSVYPCRDSTKLPQLGLDERTIHEEGDVDE
jgi:hypothetical protein